MSGQALLLGLNEVMRSSLGHSRRGASTLERPARQREKFVGRFLHARDSTREALGGAARKTLE